MAIKSQRKKGPVAMKRFLLLALALMMVLSLLACSRQEPEQDPSTPQVTTTTPSETGKPANPAKPADPTKPTKPTKPTNPTKPGKDGLFTFPQGTSLFAVTLDGMDADQALEALQSAVDAYFISISAGSDRLALSAQDLVLAVDEKALRSYAEALEKGTAADASGVITCGRAAETADYLSQKFATPLQEASIAYSSGAGEFIPVSGSAGRSLDREHVEQLLSEAVLTGCSALSLDSAITVQTPMGGDESSLRAAAETANSYLELDLTYLYEPDSGESYSRPLYRDDLASFLTIGSDFGVYIDENAIYDYAAVMAATYSASGYQDYFHTSYGGTVGYWVDYYGQSINTGALAEDIRYCVANSISGTRQAPYYASGSTENMAYGGSYVEIDLDNQYLWLYRDGELMVSCPIVSGDVSRGDMTPTGIFAVDDRDTDCELVGEDFHMFTDYWIGFWGSYGIHDAPWREGVFGGDIYLYDGSHGCANVPSYEAGLIYDYTTLGMKVIIYGGAQEVGPRQQEILCQTSFDVAEDAEDFYLGAELRYGSGMVDLSYSSSDSDVVTVSGSGLVTVQGQGSATITLSASSYGDISSAELDVTVNVHSACDEGRHSFGDWVVTKEPTCQAGEEMRTCDRCGYTETREIDPTGEHSWGDWSVTKEPTCQEGEESRTCMVCGAVETNPIPATGDHAWGEWVTVIEPGCEYPGQRISTCLICGEELDDEIPALGHSFSPDEPFCLRGCGTPNPDYVSLSDALHARILRWCIF